MRRQLTKSNIKEIIKWVVFPIPLSLLILAVKVVNKRIKKRNLTIVAKNDKLG